MPLFDAFRLYLVALRQHYTSLLISGVGFFLLSLSVLGLGGVFQSSYAMPSNVASITSITDTSSEPLPLKPIRVQINWNHQFQFAGFYAAIMQGYYQKAGLAVEIKGWKPGIDVSKEVISGRADFGVGKGEMLVDYAKGKPLSLIMASFQFSPLVLLAHTPINDLTQLSGKRLMYSGGLQIESLLNKATPTLTEPLIKSPSTGNIEDFINRNVDFYAAYSTNEPSRLRQQGIPFYILDPKSYGVQTYGDLVVTSKSMADFQPDDVKAFKDATIKGWEYALRQPEAVVDYIINHYPVVKSRDDLLAEARESVQYVKSGSIPIGHVEVTKLQATATTIKELGLISAAEFEGLNMQSFMFDETRILFNAEELAYLKSHPVITLGSDRNWGPFEFEDEKFGYSGMSADYFKYFEKLLGVRFEPVFSTSWADVTRMAEQGLIDVYSCAVATPERREYMQFTEPYLSFPMALAANPEMSYVQDYEALEGMTIAVVKDYWSHELLKNDYPAINLLVVNSAQEGLDAVIEHRAIGYLGNLGVINYTLKKHQMEGVRIVGQFDQRFELAIGVQKDNPILFGILKKALGSITPSQREEIFDRWVKLEVINSINSKQLLQIFIPIFLIIFGLLSLILVYAYQKRQQNHYIEQIHELSYATEIDLKTQNIIWSSQSFAELSGYPKEVLEGMPYLKLSWKSLEDLTIQKIYQRLINGHVWRGEMHAKKQSGESYWVDLTLTPQKNFFGKVSSILATRINITDKKRLEQIAIHDSLTTLYNRHYFNEVFEKLYAKAQRQNSSFAIAMLDIDFFKHINDFYGHQEGDKVLKQVADVIKSHFNRANDIVFRVGGEEFVVLCDYPQPDEFLTYLEHFRADVEALAIPNPKAENGVLTVSIGGVYIKQSNLSLRSSDLFGRVDKMLYQAKNSGRNRVVSEII